MDQPFRVRIPRKGDMLGIVEAMLGANKMRLYCEDDKFRICRIPGRMRKRIWIRENDAVILAPWKIQSEKSGDIVWKYSPTDAIWLRKKGLLKINL